MYENLQHRFKTNTTGHPSRQNPRYAGNAYRMSVHAKPLTAKSTKPSLRSNVSTLIFHLIQCIQCLSIQDSGMTQRVPAPIHADGLTPPIPHCWVGVVGYLRQRQFSILLETLLPIAAKSHNPELRKTDQ